MFTMDAHLMRLFKEGKVSFDDVMTYSYDPEQVRTQLIAEGVIDKELASYQVKREGLQDVLLDDETKKAKKEFKPEKVEQKIG